MENGRYISRNRIDLKRTKAPFEAQPVVSRIATSHAPPITLALVLSIVIRQISLRKGKRVEHTQHTKDAVAVSRGQPQD